MPDLTREEVEQHVRQLRARYYDKEHADKAFYVRLCDSWLTMEARVRELE